MPSVVIDTTATVAALVAAPTAPAFIRVNSFELSNAGAGEVYLADGDDAKYAGLASPAGGNSVAAAHHRDGHFDLPAGKALKLLYSTGSARLIGRVGYSVQGKNLS